MRSDNPSDTAPTIYSSTSLRSFLQIFCHPASTKGTTRRSARLNRLIPGKDFPQPIDRTTVEVAYESTVMAGPLSMLEDSHGMSTFQLVWELIAWLDVPLSALDHRQREKRVFWAPSMQSHMHHIDGE